MLGSDFRPRLTVTGKTTTSLCALSVTFLVAAGALPAAAGVRVTVREDGMKVITNEGPEHKSRRLSWRLVEVPGGELAEMIERYARARALEPKLVKALIQAESGYNVQALSNKGAMGLMQLMPGTATELAVDDPYDPDQNIRGGTAYLRSLLDRFGHKIELALAAYNAGPGAVDRHSGIPPYQETRAYVRRVLGLYHGRDVEVPTTRVARGRMPFVVREGGKILITTDPPRKN